MSEPASYSNQVSRKIQLQTFLYQLRSKDDRFRDNRSWYAVVVSVYSLAIIFQYTENGK